METAPRKGYSEKKNQFSQKNGAVYSLHKKEQDCLKT